MHQNIWTAAVAVVVAVVAVGAAFVVAVVVADVADVGAAAVGGLCSLNFRRLFFTHGSLFPFIQTNRRC